MKPSQVLDVQVDLQRWWRSQNGLDFAAGFLNHEKGSSSAPNVHPALKRRIDPSSKFTEGWDAAYLAEVEAFKLDRAPAYWVSAEMGALVEHATKSMPGQPLHSTDLPSPSGFVWLERQIAYPDIHQQLVGVRAILWAQVKIRMTHLGGELVDGVSVTLYSDTRDPGKDYLLSKDPPEVRRMMPHLLMLSVTPWAFDYPYLLTEEMSGPDPVAYVHTSIDSFRRFCAAFWTIVQQPIATKTIQRPDRAARRRAERGGLLLADDDIKVVTLRKLRDKSTDTEHEPTPVDWSHQWIVDGHWRNQWVPSLNMHRQTWINPYIKGPDDKPLVVKKKVYAFRR